MPKKIKKTSIDTEFLVSELSKLTGISIDTLNSEEFSSVFKRLFPVDLEKEKIIHPIILELSKSEEGIKYNLPRKIKLYMEAEKKCLNAESRLNNATDAKTIAKAAKKEAKLTDESSTVDKKAHKKIEKAKRKIKAARIAIKTAKAAFKSDLEDFERKRLSTVLHIAAAMAEICNKEMLASRNTPESPHSDRSSTTSTGESLRIVEIAPPSRADLPDPEAVVRDLYIGLQNGLSKAELKTHIIKFYDVLNSGDISKITTLFSQSIQNKIDGTNNLLQLIRYRALLQSEFSTEREQPNLFDDLCTHFHGVFDLLIDEPQIEALNAERVASYENKTSIESYKQRFSLLNDALTTRFRIIKTDSTIFDKIAAHTSAKKNSLDKNVYDIPSERLKFYLNRAKTYLEDSKNLVHFSAIPAETQATILGIAAESLQLNDAAQIEQSILKILRLLPKEMIENPFANSLFRALNPTYRSDTSRIARNSTTEEVPTGNSTGIAADETSPSQSETFNKPSSFNTNNILDKLDQLSQDEETRRKMKYSKTLAALYGTSNVATTLGLSLDSIINGKGAALDLGLAAQKAGIPGLSSPLSNGVLLLFLSSAITLLIGAAVYYKATSKLKLNCLQQDELTRGTNHESSLVK